MARTAPWLAIVVFSYTVVPAVAFGSGEHAIIGDAAYTLMINRLIHERQQPFLHEIYRAYYPASQSLFAGPSGEISFGDMVAIAGDFIGDPKGKLLGVEDMIALAKEDIVTIAKQFAGPLKDLKGKLLAFKTEVIDKEKDQIHQFRGTEVLSVKYAEMEEYVTSKAINMTAEEGWVGSLVDKMAVSANMKVLTRKNRYIDLLSVNIDHFAPYSEVAYKKLHAAAMELAKEYGLASRVEPIRAHLLRYAFYYEAAACHFLTDRFASGHIRTPRKELKEMCPTLESGSVMAKCMHDEDTLTGLTVRSQMHPEPWVMYGDGALFSSYSGSTPKSDDANTNFQQAVAAVGTSLLELASVMIHSRYMVSNPDKFQALQFIPEVVSARVPELFVTSKDSAGHGTIASRTSNPWQSPPTYAAVTTCVDKAADCRYFSYRSCFSIETEGRTRYLEIGAGKKLDGSCDPNADNRRECSICHCPGSVDGWGKFLTGWYTTATAPLCQCLRDAMSPCYYVTKIDPPAKGRIPALISMLSTDVDMLFRALKPTGGRVSKRKTVLPGASSRTLKDLLLPPSL